MTTNVRRLRELGCLTWKPHLQTFFDNVNNGLFFRLKRFLLRCPIMRMFENTSVAWIVSTTMFLTRTILYYLDLVKGSVQQGTEVLNTGVMMTGN